eukprot:Pgem_evm1s10921
MSSTFWTSTLAVLATVSLNVLAHSNYLTNLPNNEKIWSLEFNKLGHMNPGGGVPLSNFGMQFIEHALIWAKDECMPTKTCFCHLDSDGDGKTNGEELGDTECRWRLEQPNVPLGDKITNPNIDERNNNQSPTPVPIEGEEGTQGKENEPIEFKYDEQLYLPLMNENDSLTTGSGTTGTGIQLIAAQATVISSLLMALMLLNLTRTMENIDWGIEKQPTQKPQESTEKPQDANEKPQEPNEKLKNQLNKLMILKLKMMVTLLQN